MSIQSRKCVFVDLRPGFLSPSAGLKFADIPNGLAAVSKVPVAGWAQIAAYFGFVEFSGGFEDYKTGTPGDYGFKVLTSSDPEEKTKKLSAELANGRLAMMAIIGMFFQALRCCFGGLCWGVCCCCYVVTRWRRYILVLASGSWGQTDEQQNACDMSETRRW